MNCTEVVEEEKGGLRGTAADFKFLVVSGRLWSLNLWLLAVFVIASRKAGFAEQCTMTKSWRRGGVLFRSERGEICSRSGGAWGLKFSLQEQFSGEVLRYQRKGPSFAIPIVCLLI